MHSQRKASEAARVLAQLGARKGGLASAAALTPAERHERALAAVATRWQGKRTMPVDQAAVLTRLKGGGVVELRIAPGSGGARRLAAIYALAAKGLLVIVEARADSVTVKGAK